ncbi:MAG: hypothetical protein JSU86_03120, partial [Phycisphaerales bacterium]
HQEAGLVIFHGPFGFCLKSDYENRWDAYSIRCPMCRHEFSQRRLGGPWRESTPRRKRVSGPQEDRWFPYNHDRIRSLMGESASRYKGRLTKLARRNAKLRRRATRAECRRLGLHASQFVYDVVLLHHLVEGRDD